MLLLAPCCLPYNRSYALYTTPEDATFDPVSSFEPRTMTTAPAVIVAAEFTSAAQNAPIRPVHPIFDGMDRIMVRDYRAAIGVTTPMLLRLAPRVYNPADGSVQVRLWMPIGCWGGDTGEQTEGLRYQQAFHAALLTKLRHPIRSSNHLRSWDAGSRHLLMKWENSVNAKVSYYAEPARGWAKNEIEIKIEITTHPCILVFTPNGLLC